MSKLKDRLSVLNRQFREVTIRSIDSDDSEIAYYRRPTELEDQVLRKAMNEEFETLIKGFKAGESSTYQHFIELFKVAGKEASVNAIINSQTETMRQDAVRELGEAEPAADSSKEDREAYVEKLKPLFEQRVERLRGILNAEPDDVLPEKAAEIRIESMARDRAWELYRHRLIASSIYEKDDATDQFELVFENHEDVPNCLDSDMINTITKLVLDEINRVKNLPLRSAAKT
jgi:rubrerythrin